LSLQSLPATTTLSFPKLKFVGSLFTIGGTIATTVDFPSLEHIGSSTDISGSTITSIQLPKLTVSGGQLSPNSMSSLTTLSFPKLKCTNGFNPYSMSSLTTLEAPELEVNGGNLNCSSMASVTTLLFPKLKTNAGVVYAANMAGLTTVSLPAIERIGIGLTSGNMIVLDTNVGNITTLNLGTNLKQIGNGGGNIKITSASLNQTSVDNLLVLLASLDGTNGTTTFSDRTVTITGSSSAPSAIGLTAKATLVSRGCTVTHN
jgi:hypothetical protein